MERAWQDFGQKVDLTARLREILINYPEGTSILKELVQVEAVWFPPREEWHMHCCLTGPVHSPANAVLPSRC